MLCIVEGPDGAGKTTLIEAMRQRIKRYFWILRSSHPPSNSHEIWTFLRTIESRPDNDMGFLFDRHPLISEPIYGPILRDKDLLGLGNRVTLVKTLRNHLHRIETSPLIIYCRPPTDTIARNVRRNANEQLEGVVERIQPLIEAYDGLMDEMDETEGLQTLRYDYTCDNLESFVRDIETRLPVFS